MTLLAKYDFFYFSRSLESCNSASSEAILNFSTDLKSPVHSLFTIYYDKSSFNQVFRSKKSCGLAYRADFHWFLCVSHRSWCGGPVAKATFPPPPAAPAPHPDFSSNRPSLTAVGRFAHKFVGYSAHMP
jgi:hypothetical protein